MNEARSPLYRSRYFLLFGLKVTIIINRQMTRVKFLSKGRNSALVFLEKNRKGHGKYMLIWSIFFQRKVRRVVSQWGDELGHALMIIRLGRTIRMALKKGKKKGMTLESMAQTLRRVREEIYIFS